MLKQPSNAVLLEKICNVHDRLSSIEEHLRTLNGQVAKNTAHRNRQYIINIILGSIGTALLGGSVSIAVLIFEKVLI